MRRQRARRGRGAAREQGAQCADRRVGRAALLLRERFDEGVGEHLVERDGRVGRGLGPEHRAAPDRALEAAEEALRQEAGERAYLGLGGAPVEVREEEGDGGALGLEEVEEGEALGAGGSVEYA